MTKIPSKPRTGARSQPKFLGYRHCAYCKMPFMKWSDQGNTLFCSNICELTHERFDALRYWQKREESQATSPNGKGVFPLVDPSREAD